MTTGSVHCLVFLMLTTVYHANSFETGAPFSTCFTQYPKHSNHGTQNAPSPFRFELTPSTYKPGQEVQIKVTDSNGQHFRGIQIAARRATGNTDVIVGRFVEFPTNKLKAFNCFGGYQNMLTHLDKDKVKLLAFKWKAPNENVGDVVFIATIVREYKVFWHGLRASLPVDSNAKVEPPKYPDIPLSPQTSSISFDECGDSKGCFYYPRYCSGSDCLVAATYQYRPDSKNFVFELYANNNEDYISIGFSHDQWMGNDVTMACTGRTGDLSVQEGFNPDQFNERHLSIFSSSHEVRYTEGKLECRFVLPESFEVYRVAQNTNSSLASTTTWNLKDKEYHLFMAWGQSMPESTVLAHHHEYPAMTLSTVDLTEKVITLSSGFQTLVRLHGSLMSIAWILVTGVVTVVARHYRDWAPRTRWFGTKVWFQVHRGLAILVFLLTITGVTVIFTNYGLKINKHAVYHAALGLTVVCLMCLQITSGILRPGGDHKNRPYFNWGHWALGHTTHLLSVTTMFLAYDIKFINPDQRTMGFVALSVWVVVDIVWNGVFEVIKQRRQRGDSKDLEPVGDNQFKIVGHVAAPFGTCDVILLVIYACTLVALCTGCLTVFLLY